MLFDFIDFKEYQFKFVGLIKEIKKIGLFLGMGAGKTVISLTAAKELLDSGEVKHVLIIAPLRVANTVWAQEAMKWNHLKLLHIRICTGSTSDRLFNLHRHADVHVINRENVPWLIDNFPWKWDMVIIDESSSFKNHASKRFKALRRISHQIKYLVELTGTPSPNGYMDLWSQLFLLDRGERLGKNITAFRNRFFTPDGYNGYSYRIKPGAADKINSLISDICFTMELETEFGSTNVPVHVELPQEVRKQYRELEKEFIVSLKEGDIMAPSKANVGNKLLQICNGAVYDEDRKVHIVHDEKIKALKEIMEDNPNENFLVSYSYQHDLARIKKAFPHAVELSKDGKEIIEWDKGNIKMMLVHPACLHPSTEVLTESRGWVKIIDVKYDEKVFDGIEFVSHLGCHFSGFKRVINKFGITLTPNHKLLIDNKWIEAKDVSNSKNTEEEARYTYTGNDNYLGEMLPLRGCERDTASKRSESKPPKEKTLPSLYRRDFPQNDKHENLGNLERYNREDDKGIWHRLPSLWGKRYRCVERMAKFREFLQRHVTRLRGTSYYRPYQQLKRILKRKLQMGHQHATTGKQTEQQSFNTQRAKHAPRRILQEDRCEPRGDNSPSRQRDEPKRSFERLQQIKLSPVSEISKVYDLVDCGPRNRFLIRNSQGDVFISHNSAGHGLNLQFGGSVAVWFGLPWSLEYYQQLNKRLDRNGQIKKVRLFHIIVKGGMCEKVMLALNGKAKTQKELMEYLKINLK